MGEQNNNEMNTQPQVQNVESTTIQPNVEISNEVKPPKKKRNWLFTLFACIMTAVIVILAMNIGQQLSKGVEKNSSGSSNTTNDSNSNSNEEKIPDNCSADTPTNSTIIFDSSKSINNTNEKNYILSSQGPAGIYATTDTTQNILKLSFTPATVAKYYSLNWGNNVATTAKTDEIKFSKRIIDLFFGGFGQSSSGDTLFILLEDGTVEYIPLVHMFNHVQGTAVSYGAIKDVTGVVKFTIADKGESVTTLAIKGDGSFYDLEVALKDTGNY